MGAGRTTEYLRHSLIPYRHDPPDVFETGQNPTLLKLPNSQTHGVLTHRAPANGTMSFITVEDGLLRDPAETLADIKGRRLRPGG